MKKRLVLEMEIDDVYAMDKYLYAHKDFCDFINFNIVDSKGLKSRIEVDYSIGAVTCHVADPGFSTELHATIVTKLNECSILPKAPEGSKRTGIALDTTLNLTDIENILTGHFKIAQLNAFYILPCGKQTVAGRAIAVRKARENEDYLEVVVEHAEDDVTISDLSISPVALVSGQFIGKKVTEVNAIYIYDRIANREVLKSIKEGH